MQELRWCDFGNVDGDRLQIRGSMAGARTITGLYAANHVRA
jgi:hypothetical protein